MTRVRSIAFRSARSVPGLTGRWRSAISAVAVLRGSTTITPTSGAFLRSLIRPKVIGWHSAVFVPTSKKHFAWVMSAYEAGGPSVPKAPGIPRDRARHAKPGVGVQVVGTYSGPGELVYRIVVLGQKLAGDVQPGSVRAELLRCPRTACPRVRPAPRPTRRGRDLLCRYAAAGASADPPSGRPRVARRAWDTAFRSLPDGRRRPLWRLSCHPLPRPRRRNRRRSRDRSNVPWHPARPCRPCRSRRETGSNQPPAAASAGWTPRDPVPLVKLDQPGFGASYPYHARSVARAAHRDHWPNVYVFRTYHA